MLRHREVLQHIDKELPQVSQHTLTRTHIIMPSFHSFRSRSRFFFLLQSILKAKHSTPAHTALSATEEHPAGLLKQQSHIKLKLADEIQTANFSKS